MKYFVFVFLATFFLVQWSGVDSAAKGAPTMEQQKLQSTLPDKGCGCPCGKSCQCGLSILKSLHNVTNGVLYQKGDREPIDLKDSNITSIMIDPKTNVTVIRYGPCDDKIVYVYPDDKKSMKTKIVDGLCKAGIYLTKPHWDKSLLC